MVLFEYTPCRSGSPQGVLGGVQGRAGFLAAGAAGVVCATRVCAAAARGTSASIPARSAAPVRLVMVLILHIAPSVRCVRCIVAHGSRPSDQWILKRAIKRVGG